MAPVCIAVSILSAVALAALMQLTIFKPLQQLNVNAAKRLQGEVTPALNGDGDVAALDSMIAALAAQRSWALYRERMITDKSISMVCSLDEHMEFTDVGSTSEQLLAYQPADLIGKSLSEFVIDADLDRTYRRFGKVAATRTSNTLDNRIRCGDSTIRDMEWTIEWSETTKLYSCVVKDISERKNLERLKDEFFAMVTHDLRTPLTSLKISVASLLNDKACTLSPTALKTLSIADDDLTRLIRLISDLLDWEKLGAPNFTVNPKPTSVGPIVHNAIATLSPLAEQKELTITAQMKEQQILADPERLMQVVTNILSNAIKFAPDGSEVRVETQDLGEWLEVRISDNGPGIPSELDSGIFEPFKQHKANEKKSPDGSGLGLAICRRIIHAHGGRIGFTSRPDGGTTFWFRLRKAKADEYSHPVLKKQDS